MSESNTFTLPDPYEGWTTEQLKDHCRKLCRKISHDEMIILALSEGTSVERLPPSDRIFIQKLREAYSD